MAHQAGVIEALKDWGLTVRTTPGWNVRGGGDFDPKGHVCHHDVIGDQEGTHDEVPRIIIDGRPDLDGPLANFWLERDGDVHLVAAGRANHAGSGGWRGLSGNASVWGTEANNLGVPSDPWPDEQLEAWYRLCAATAEFSGFGVEMVCGHKEWTSRKIDPHSIDMSQFRRNVAEATKGFTMDKEVSQAFHNMYRLQYETALASAKRDERTLRAIWKSRRDAKEATDDLDGDLLEVSKDIERIEHKMKELG